jgi:hypothetical protein
VSIPKLFFAKCEIVLPRIHARCFWEGAQQISLLDIHKSAFIPMAVRNKKKNRNDEGDANSAFSAGAANPLSGRVPN